MKVIDLLNKIANGEIETFYKFKYRNKIVTMDYLLDNYLFLEILNDEVEIIEEDKKIGKLNESYYCDEPALIEDMVHTINEIIDKVNEMSDK